MSNYLVKYDERVIAVWPSLWMAAQYYRLMSASSIPSVYIVKESN